MAHNILVVDSNQAFAIILKEGLEATGEYKVALVHSGADALEAVIENPFDLVIVDMGLPDVKPARLLKAIREAKPAMRMMLIPLFGGQVGNDLGDVQVEGVLPKPFFVGDLPRLVGEAMGAAAVPAPGPTQAAEVKEAAPAPAATHLQQEDRPAPPAVEERSPPDEAPAEEVEPGETSEALERLRDKERQIVQLLKGLNREVRAECILVTSGTQLIAFSGLIGREQTARLAQLVAEAAAAASRAASFLGEPSGHFEQSLHEGAEYRLYSLVVADDVVLSLALSTEVPLGTLRYQARQTAEELLALIT